MLVKIKGTTYMVQWRHNPPYDDYSEITKKSTRKSNGGTSCYLYQLTAPDTKVLVDKAELKCYYRDCFSKETGRKFSMTQVLNHGRTPIVVNDKIVGHEDDGTFNKEVRESFWKTYFGRLKTKV